jgi:hypothetical protein
MQKQKVKEKGKAVEQKFSSDLPTALSIESEYEFQDEDFVADFEAAKKASLAEIAFHDPMYAQTSLKIGSSSTAPRNNDAPRERDESIEDHNHHFKPPSSLRSLFLDQFLLSENELFDRPSSRSSSSDSDLPELSVALAQWHANKEAKKNINSKFFKVYRTLIYFRYYEA